MLSIDSCKFSWVNCLSPPSKPSYDSLYPLQRNGTSQPSVRPVSRNPLSPLCITLIAKTGHAEAHQRLHLLLHAEEFLHSLRIC